MRVVNTPSDFGNNGARPVPNPLSHEGRRLLDRRQFLGHAGSGLFAIALAHVLASQRLLAMGENKTDVAT